jgi:hypothetical protein
MSFVSTDPVSHQGKTNTWLTPLPLIHSLGEFDLDPCAYPGHKTAKEMICLPDCGLKNDWFGRVWLNPPYGREQQAWLKKLQSHGNGIALVFARLETIWIQPFIANGFFQLRGRVKFLDSTFNESSNAGAPSMLIPFGRKNIGAILSSDLEGKWFQ